MQFYLVNKRALFSAVEAHRALYGDKGKTDTFGTYMNEKCFACNQKHGTLRVSCKRYTDLIQFTENGKEKCGKVMEYDLADYDE